MNTLRNSFPLLILKVQVIIIIGFVTFGCGGGIQSLEEEEVVPDYCEFSSPLSAFKTSDYYYPDNIYTWTRTGDIYKTFNRVTTYFLDNYSGDDIRDKGALHPGVDIASSDEDVYAVADGTVVKTGYDSGGWGNYVVIKHDNVRIWDWKIGDFMHEDDEVVIRHCYSVYAHMKNDSIPERFSGSDRSVKQGDVIGITWGTPNYGHHLHFQIQYELADNGTGIYWPIINNHAYKTDGSDDNSVTSNDQYNCLKRVAEPIHTIKKNALAFGQRHPDMSGGYIGYDGSIYYPNSSKLNSLNRTGSSGVPGIDIGEEKLSTPAHLTATQGVYADKVVLFYNMNWFCNAF